MQAISAAIVAFPALATALPAGKPLNGTLGLGMNVTSVGTVFNVSTGSPVPLAPKAGADGTGPEMGLYKRQLLGLPVGGVVPITPGLVNNAARRTERDARKLANDVRRTQVDAVRLRNDQLRLASLGAAGGIGGIGGIGGLGSAAAIGLPGVGLPIGGVAGVPVPVPVRAPAPVVGLNVATPLVSAGVGIL